MAKSPQLESTKRKSIMKVKVLVTHPDAVLPTKAYPNDFCYDCVAVSEEEIAPNVWKYGLGLAFQIKRDMTKPFCGMMITTKPDSDEITGKHIFSMKVDMAGADVNLSIDARPRSSVWKTGMVLSNCEGTIDENFTGSVSAVFYHVMPNMPRYKVGDRVCQIKLGFTLPMEFEQVDSLDSTDRSNNGYGSSGR